MISELLYDGAIVGVFSSEEAARKFARSNDYGTFSILPIGTFLHTDIDEDS